MNERDGMITDTTGFVGVEVIRTPVGEGIRKGAIEENDFGV